MLLLVEITVSTGGTSPAVVLADFVDVVPTVVTIVTSLLTTRSRDGRIAATVHYPHTGTLAIMLLTPPPEMLTATLTSAEADVVTVVV